MVANIKETHAHIGGLSLRGTTHLARLRKLELESGGKSFATVTL